MSNAVPYTQSPFNLSRKDKFLLVLDVPPALKQITSKFIRDDVNILPDTMQFSVAGAVVPDISVPAVQNRYAGQTYTATSYSRDPYPPLTVDFIVDNRFNNYWVLYTWLNLLNDDTTGTYDNANLTIPTHSIPNPHANGQISQYKTNLTIYGLDEYNKRIISFVYTDAFPTNLGGISFSYKDSGEVETSVTFSYSQLHVTPIWEIENL
jgi:hypothetical protein